MTRAIYIELMQLFIGLGPGIYNSSLIAGCPQARRWLYLFYLSWSMEVFRQVVLKLLEYLVIQNE